MAGGRSARSITRITTFFSHKLFTSTIFTLLFLASIFLFLSSFSPNDGIGIGFGTTFRRTFLVLNSDPLRTRIDLIYRQAADYIALIHVYSSYARRLKLDNSRQLRVFETLSTGFSDLTSRLDSDPPSDEETLRAIEKEARDRIKLARQVISEHKELFDTQIKIQKLRDTIFAVGEQLHRAQKLGALSSRIAAGATPKSLHCLAMRLMEERIAHPEAYRRLNSPDLSDPELFHYAILSDNVIAVSVVVNSAVHNAKEPSKMVFHVVTNQMYAPAMQVWFTRRPPKKGARVEVRSVSEFVFLNVSYSPVVRQIEFGRRDLVLLDYLRFYLPEMFPKLRRIIYLEDDVVVQRDLTGLWNMDLDEKVNGAVEMCFGSFRRYARYMNFSNPGVREGFSPRACAWNFGVNLFDLDAWRRERCTQQFHRYQNMNEDGTMWNAENVLPAGLMTFYKTTKAIDKSWHVMGLGYNPSVTSDEIRNAAVIHFNGNMKPWLDVALNQYKHLWTKYVDTDMEFLPLCNFGL